MSNSTKTIGPKNDDISHCFVAASYAPPRTATQSRPKPLLISRPIFRPIKRFNFVPSIPVRQVPSQQVELSIFNLPSNYPFMLDEQKPQKKKKNKSLDLLSPQP